VPPEVQTEAESAGEIVLHCASEWEHRVAEKEIDTEQNDGQDKQRFPIQLGFMVRKKTRGPRGWAYFCIFRCST